MYISAKPAPVVRFTIGSEASSGSTPLTSFTFERTSASARSASASSLSFSVMVDTFCAEEDSMMVHAFGRGHRLLQGRGDEALDLVGVGAG